MGTDTAGLFGSEKLKVSLAGGTVKSLGERKNYEIVI